MNSTLVLDLTPNVVQLTLNATYNTTTQTFDYSPSDYSTDYNN